MGSVGLSITYFTADANSKREYTPLLSICG